MLSLLLGCLAFAGCSWVVSNSAMQRVLESDAIATANEWADYLAISIPDIDAVVEGRSASPATNDFLRKTHRIGQVFRYRIYDATGVVRLDSPNDPYAVGPDAAIARQTALLGSAAFRTGRGDGIQLPKFYAEAYVPLQIAGRNRGTIEVYVDQTAKAALMEGQAITAVLAIAALTALGFLLPMGAYLLKSREARESVSYVSMHDDLTKLHNRSAFKAILEERIRKSSKEHLEFEVFFVDLDRFKTINDSRGHAAGDAVLRHIASRLLDLVGPAGEVARLGGDEFAIYYPQDRRLTDRNLLGERIVGLLGLAFDIEGTDTVIGASVGISTFPRDGVTSEALLKAADIALYEAKQNGRGRCVRFEHSMQMRVQRRLALENRLKTATTHHEFAVYYQPLQDLQSSKLSGFEALLRLWDDAGEPVPPTIFIPIAEQMGLIGAIGQSTLNEACRTAAMWPDDLKVAVNLSALVEVVSKALSSSGLDPHRLELEITEGVLIDDTASVLRQLEGIKQLGVSIALDDFGTGYSSLSYLWMFPFDRVKVDRSFISRLSDEDGKSREVLSSILALGKSLQMTVTAEGVETPEQLALIRQMNIDTLQGYLYGRPIPETELAATILKLSGVIAPSTAQNSIVQNNLGSPGQGGSDDVPANSAEAKKTGR
jgi:diguanylate cyclase (GGDEF)-like protein